MAHRDSQNAPKPPNSTPPKTFPLRKQMIPAISWASPPNMNATPKTTGVVPTGTMLALIMLNMKVVVANPARASGAAFPQPMAPEAAGGWPVGWASRSRCRSMEAMRFSLRYVAVYCRMNCPSTAAKRQRSRPAPPKVGACQPRASPIASPREGTAHLRQAFTMYQRTGALGTYRQDRQGDPPRQHAKSDSMTPALEP